MFSRRDRQMRARGIFPGPCNRTSSAGQTFVFAYTCQGRHGQVRLARPEISSSALRVTVAYTAVALAHKQGQVESKPVSSCWCSRCWLLAYRSSGYMAGILCFCLSMIVWSQKRWQLRSRAVCPETGTWRGLFTWPIMTWNLHRPSRFTHMPRRRRTVSGRSFVWLGKKAHATATWRNGD